MLLESDPRQSPVQGLVSGCPPLVLEPAMVVLARENSIPPESLCHEAWPLSTGLDYHQLSNSIPDASRLDSALSRLVMSRCDIACRSEYS